MSDLQILKGAQRQFMFWGFALGAILSAGFSLQQAMTTTVPLTPELRARQKAAWAQGENWRETANLTAAKARSLVLGGVTFLLGSGAIVVSTSRPKNLSTPVLDAVDTPQAIVDDDEYLNQGQIVLDKLTDLFVEHTWIEEVCDVDGADALPLLIIIGQPGKGKTALAQSIGILRHLLNGAGMTIFDPEASKSYRKGVLVFGNVVGFLSQSVGSALAGDYGHLPFRDQFLNNHAEFKERANAGLLENHTALYDELKQWAGNGVDNHGFTSEEMLDFYNGYPALRKQGVKIIWLWHAASNNGAGLDKLPPKSNILTDLLNYAAVIDLNAVPEDIQTKYRKKKSNHLGIAMYKPMGVNNIQGNYELITIPKILHPGTLIDMVGKAAEYFGIRVNGKRDPDLAKRKAEVRKKINRRFKAVDPSPDGNFRSSLESLIEINFSQQRIVYASYSFDIYELVDGLDIESMASRELFHQLLVYLEDPNTPVKPTDNGFYRMRDIYRNWGDKPNREPKFSSTEKLRDFLAIYVEGGHGEWGNELRSLWSPPENTADFA